MNQRGSRQSPACWNRREGKKRSGIRDKRKERMESRWGGIERIKNTDFTES